MKLVNIDAVIETINFSIESDIYTPFSEMLMKEVREFLKGLPEANIASLCNVRENGKLITKILDADAENKAYEACETCDNYFSESAAQFCINEVPEEDD